MSMPGELAELRRRVTQVKDRCREKILGYRCQISELRQIVKLLEEDNHHFQKRPCPTCREISSLLGRPFGCNVKLATEDKGRKE